MPPRLLEPDEAAVEWLAGALVGGAVVAVPTDTVYGLAARPADRSALTRLFTLKRRPTDVAVPVLVGRAEQVTAVAGRLEPAAARLARRHWPGPLTLVVPRAPGFDADLGGPPSARPTVGIRWPDQALVGSLCRRVGPLAVTSANLHGAPPATTATAVLEAFSSAEGLDAVVDGGACEGTPSTVLECRGWSVRCLRPGALSWEDPPAGPDGDGTSGGEWTDLRRMGAGGRG